MELRAQSLLLAKVPPELRIIIWDYAFDVQTLHFECVDDRLQCAWCDDEHHLTKLGFRHSCWNARRFISREGRRPLPSRPSTEQGQSRASLLLVCKTMYVHVRLSCDFRNSDTILTRTAAILRHAICYMNAPRLPQEERSRSESCHACCHPVCIVCEHYS